MQLLGLSNVAGITSYSQLLKELERIRTEIMEKEVADKATELMQENIDTEVYKAYTPMSDNSRTGKLRESVETGMQQDDTLVVYNSRMDTGFKGELRDVVGVIETGKGYNYGGNLDERIGKREFIKATKEDLKNGEFRQALKDGFKNRGIETD